MRKPYPVSSKEWRIEKAFMSDTSGVKWRQVAKAKRPRSCKVRNPGRLVFSLHTSPECGRIAAPPVTKTPRLVRPIEALLNEHRARTSRLLLLLFSRRKQHVVQNEPVARRGGVQGQVGGFFAHQVLVVFGVVAAVKRPGALAQRAVQVAGFVRRPSGSG